MFSIGRHCKTQQSKNIIVLKSHLATKEMHTHAAFINNQHSTQKVLPPFYLLVL
jgi:hypothetical protein